MGIVVVAYRVSPVLLFVETFCLCYFFKLFATLPRGPRKKIFSSAVGKDIIEYKNALLVKSKYYDQLGCKLPPSFCGQHTMAMIIYYDGSSLLSIMHAW